MSDDSLFREVDEEVRQDQYKKLWDRYGNAIIAACVVLVALVAAFKGWQYWQVKQSETTAESFFSAAKLADGGKAADAAAEFKTITQTGYAPLARMREAANLAASGKTADAVAAYDAVAADASVEASLRDAARLRAAYALADTAKPDELKSRIANFDAAGNPWRHAAREIMAIAAWRTSDYKLASTEVDAILADAETPGALRQRMTALHDLLVPLLAAK